MKKHHQIKNLHFRDERIILTIDGKEYSFSLTSVSKRLKGASPEDLNNFVISPSGYGISWPTIDEDLSIDGLLGKKHKPIPKRKTISA